MELNICVCDDDGVAVGMITGALSGILEKKGVRADISAYRDVRALEEDMRVKAFDLILLDIDMPGYTEMLIEARQIAVKRMVDEAEALGADAIINVRYGSASVMQGAAEVIAYGTAVRYR